VDGVLADHEPLRDLRVGETVRDQSQHLELAARQPERFALAGFHHEIVEVCRDGYVFVTELCVHYTRLDG
jgi:hypothetical protein